MDILNTVRIEYKYNTVTITVELHFEIHLYHCVDRGLGLIDGLGAIRRHDRPLFYSSQHFFSTFPTMSQIGFVTNDSCG